MTDTIPLNELGTYLDTVDYPIDRPTLSDQCSAVTVDLADGTVNLGTILEGSSAETFDSPDDAYTEILNLLPRRAVGEPYQSEGDA